MNPASYATRTLAPLAPLHGAAARSARLWGLASVILAIPNLLVIRFWVALAGGRLEWSAFVLQQQGALEVVVYAIYVVLALSGGYAALHRAIRIRAVRHSGVTTLLAGTLAMWRIAAETGTLECLRGGI